jgi:hypothetical protein
MAKGQKRGAEVRAAIAAEQKKVRDIPRPTTGRIGLNLHNVLAFMQGAKLSEVEGVFHAVDRRMRELGIEPNKRAHKTVAAQSSQGNTKAIIVWADNATKDDEGDLQVLRAVTNVRLTLSGTKH